jgi:hypothetical protein
MKVVSVLCICGLLLVAPLAGAAEPQSAPAVSWDSLSAEQRQLLADFESRWSRLPPQRQRSLARGSQRWLSMPPEQRQQAGERFKRWKSLDADQRKAIRERYRQFKQLPDDEQDPQELPSVPEPDSGAAARVAATFSRSAAAGAAAAQREIAAMSGHDAGRCGGQSQVWIGSFAPIQATASVRSARG